jgi:hypothetical protein
MGATLLLAVAETLLLAAAEMLQLTPAGVFLPRKVSSAPSALAQLIFAVFADFLAGAVEQVASLYAASFSRSATRADTLLAEPLSSMFTPASVAGATSAAQAGAAIKANNNSKIFFMVILPFVVKK